MTKPIRVVADAVDATHPLAVDRSVVGQLGGAIELLGAGQAVLGSVRVAAPGWGRLSPAEPARPTSLPGVTMMPSFPVKEPQHARLRGKLRFIAVRLAAGGAAPVGGSVAGVTEVARDALTRVNALWGACGIDFGSPDDVQVTVVDPPPSHLLVIGCGHGLPATGGEIRFTVRGGGSVRTLRVPSERGWAPREVARRVAAELAKAGFGVRLADNPNAGSAAGGSVDISVRSSRGALLEFGAPTSGILSTDRTLGVCIGGVDLEDGLQHFRDVDSMVGTVEERALIRAFDDGDPKTIDVYLVPGFGQGGRIGESFIESDEGGISNAIIVDRAGIRSNRASATLAHELGHVLLDDPGHPDDYGVDVPTRLMDADASDGSAFGPRRITLSECRRAVVESGPSARAPILAPAPLAPWKVQRPQQSLWEWPIPKRFTTAKARRSLYF